MSELEKPVWNTENLASQTGGEWRGAHVSDVRGFHFDTRELVRGGMFIALTTGQRDGHDFLPMAVEAGAAAALVERYRNDVAIPQLRVPDTLAALQSLGRHCRNVFPGKVIAITGSNGKTSTKDLLLQLLGRDFGTATYGNFNNHIGVPLSLLRLDPSSHRYGIFELGMNRPGEISMLREWVRPQLSIVTSVGPAHLEGLGTVEAVAREKSSVARGEGGFPEECYIHADCLQYSSFRDLSCDVCVLDNGTDCKFGELPGNYRQLNYRTTTRPDGGLRLTWSGAASSGCYSLRREWSPGMCRNAILALAVAEQLGVAPDTLAERLEMWQPGDLRARMVAAGVRDWYIDCYNANPASMMDALEAFVRLAGNRPRCFILGEMRELGEAADRLHADVARRLPLRQGDVLVLAGEGARWYLNGLSEDCRNNCEIIEVGDAPDAAGRVEEFEGAVFLKGSRVARLERLYEVVEGAKC